ncbi:MAG: CCA tRNA nucleotidyltransferase [Acidobacteriaceae bacterium]
MPDYTHLLETRLTTDQKLALNSVTEIARAHNMTVYLTGGAVRDIISGSSVRDLDVSVQGNALKLRKDLEKAGFDLTGEHTPSQTLFANFHQHARLEVSSTRREEFAKPGRAEYAPAGILDDLRRRDFTANAMALSLNEGSYGLMLDPLNGAADIQAQHVRLVDNYGFLNDPIRLVRATRLMARTGWSMEERTKARYDQAKTEGVISHITAYQRGYELEETAYEEDALVILKALEAEGWMKHLFPAWTHHSADAAGLQRLHDNLVRLMMAGLHPDASAAAFTLLTAKMPSNQLGALKKLFPRRGLAHDVAALEHDAKAFSKQLLSKEAATSSQTWKLFHAAKPEAVLWLFHTGKSAAIQGRYTDFFTKWTEARQRTPYAILQEMRIKPGMENYVDILEKLTFAFMDGEVDSEESIRKFLGPFSPPAPPPPVVVRRPRSTKRVDVPKEKKKTAKAVHAEEVVAAGDVSVVAQAAVPAIVTEGKVKAASGKKTETLPRTMPEPGPASATKPVAKTIVPAKPVVAAKTTKKAVARPVVAATSPTKPPAKTATKPVAKKAGPLAKKVESLAKKAPVVKPVQKPVVKVEQRPTEKSSSRPVAKPAATPVQKSTSRPTQRPGMKAEQKLAARPAAKLPVKPKARPEEGPAHKGPAAGPSAKVAAKPAPAKASVTKPAPRSAAKSVAKPAPANKKPADKKTAAKEAPKPANKKAVIQAEKKSGGPSHKK